MVSLICAEAIFWTAFSLENFINTLLSGHLCHAELWHKKSKRHFICATEGVPFAEKSGALRAPGTKTVMGMWEMTCFISILVKSGPGLARYLFSMRKTFVSWAFWPNPDRAWRGTFSLGGKALFHKHFKQNQWKSYENLNKVWKK